MPDLVDQKRPTAGRAGDTNIKFNQQADRVFKVSLRVVTVFVLIFLGIIFTTLLVTSIPSFKRFGLSFLTSRAWEDRMTLVQDLTLSRGVIDPLIRISISAPLEAETILPGKNLLFEDSQGRTLPFDWVIPESNQNLLLLYPRSLEDRTEYQVILLPGIKDYKNHALPYHYRLSFEVNTAVDSGLTDLQFIDHRNGKPIRELDGSDLKWFGALPFIVGTLLTSILALLISLPFSLAIAIFLGEYFTNGPLSTFMQTTNELLAGIPSIIYGAWGFAFIVPLMSRWFPQSNSGGAGILTAALILSIMIIPYSASLAREVIKLVPSDIKEAAFGMGATRFSVIRKVILPYASSGIFAGILLSFGRALGETMAVTMVIGNRNSIPKTIFDGGQTIASLIANEYGEAGTLKMSALSELGMILFVITLLFGILGRFIIKKLSLKDQK